MTLNEDQKKIVVNAGEIDLSSEALAYKLGLNETEVKRELQNRNSEIKKLFDIGQEFHMVDVFNAMKELAIKGDIAAAEMMIKIKNEHNYQKTARKLFGH
jgi:hypothetical protein